KYFWPRPSAAGANGYDGASSSGSNYGPSSAKLLAAVTDKAKAVSEASEGRKAPIDLVTSSGSGLDPHISPLSAYLQVVRISKVRGLREEDVRSVVQANLEQRSLGLFGEPRVNVLKMNLALDALPPR
ncbi:MAG: potassium-transporting ATPase subunit C, partial [Chitinophagales bacterium]|nr:potassium-transporting ATPase subunit C [Hyphomicrobiales bacterium]